MGKVTKIPTKAMKEAMGVLGLKESDFKPMVDDRPKTAIIEAADKLLEDVRSGKVIGFAVATVSAGEPYTGSASAFMLGVDPINHKLLLAAIEEMRHEFKHALRGG